MTVRPAVEGDEALLLAWANDPVARAAGFERDTIAPEVHRRWFASRLAESSSGRIWIGLEDGRPIGVVRVETASDGALVVGIALDAAERGRRMSLTLLSAGLEAARAAFAEARFRAWIRPSNVASLALFRRAGFEAPASRPAVAPPGAGPADVVVERD